MANVKAEKAFWGGRTSQNDPTDERVARRDEILTNALTEICEFDGLGRKLTSKDANAMVHIAFAALINANG